MVQLEVIRAGIDLTLEEFEHACRAMLAALERGQAISDPAAYIIRYLQEVSNGVRT